MSRRQSRGKLGRFIKMGLVVVVVLFFTIVIGSYLILRSYLASDEFRQLAERKLGEETEGTVQLKPIELRGWEFSTEGLTVHEGEEIHNLELSELSGEVSPGKAIRGEAWRIEQIIARRLRVDIKKDKKKAVAPVPAPAPAPPAPPAPVLQPKTPPQSQPQSLAEKPKRKKKKRRFWKKWIPRDFELGEGRIDSLSGSFQKKNKLYTWEGIRVLIKEDKPNHGYRVTLKDGNLGFPIKNLDNIKTAKLSQIDGSIQGRTFHVQKGVLNSERAQLTFMGEFSKQGSFVEGELRGLDSKRLLDTDWKQRISGDLEADFTVQRKRKKSSIVEGDVRMINGLLTALPILDRLAAYVETERYRRIPLKTARFHIRREGRGKNKVLQVRNILIDSPGLLRVEGTIDLKGEEVFGKLLLGLAPGTLSKIPGAETKVFQPGTDSLLWTPVTLSGTRHDVKEDLSERLLEAAGERMLEFLPGTGDYALKFSGEIMKFKKGEVDREHLKAQAIQTGSQIIQEGAGLIEGITGQKIKDKDLKKGAEALEKIMEEKGDDLIEDGIDALEGFFGKRRKKKESEKTD